MTYMPEIVERPDRYKVSVQQYAFYHANGYLKVPALMPKNDVLRLYEWADDLLFGRENVPGMDPLPPNTPFDQLLQRFSRIHMLHRVQQTGEWGLLHPQVLDVLEALIGPDVLALQSMLFFNPPGRGGQGWHQDSYYIPTYPDTLIGAWIALEEADEENGCLWVAPGSNVEPIYPPTSTSFSVHSTGAFENLNTIDNASHLDDEVNTLSKVVSKYPAPISVPMNPGDVLFFHAHMFHRSYPNRTTDRMRRSYVCHYCNARSWVPWNHGAPFEEDAANNLHILARGRTHLPFALPVFGTPVDTTQTDASSTAVPVRVMGGDDDGMIAIQQEVNSFTPPGGEST